MSKVSHVILKFFYIILDSSISALRIVTTLYEVQTHNLEGFVWP